MKGGINIGNLLKQTTRIRADMEALELNLKKYSMSPTVEAKQKREEIVSEQLEDYEPRLNYIIEKISGLDYKIRKNWKSDYIISSLISNLAKDTDKSYKTVENDVINLWRDNDGL